MLLPALSLLPRSYAATTTLDGTNCVGTLGGSWDGVNTCTLTTSYTILSGDELDVGPASFTRLALSTSSDLIIQSGGTLKICNGELDMTMSSSALHNSGTLDIGVGSCAPNNIVNLQGTVVNEGTITIDSGGQVATAEGSSTSIYNAGSIDLVSGRLTILAPGQLDDHCTTSDIYFPGVLRFFGPVTLSNCPPSIPVTGGSIDFSTDSGSIVPSTSTGPTPGIPSGDIAT